MFDSIKTLAKATARRIVAASGVMLRGHYDAAKTTKDNREHWKPARGETPLQVNTYKTRSTLADRAQYEVDNNAYCSGMISTLAKDTIGYTAPKLQVLTVSPTMNTFIEGEWLKYSEHELVNLPAKWRLLDETKRIQGDSFLVFYTDNELESDIGHSLNCHIIAGKRVHDPYLSMFGQLDGDILNDDGVIVDTRKGRPIEYKILPIETELYGYHSAYQPQTVSAENVLQWFNPRRPGQFRGVCEIAPVLDLFGQLRRIGTATLTAAEFASMLAGVLKTSNPATEAAKMTDWAEYKMTKGMLISVPDGWDVTQFKSEQPTTSQQMFVNLVLREIGRILDMPFGIISGDSSAYNYSSMRMDVQGYLAQIRFDRHQLRIRGIDPYFKAWIKEFALRHPIVMQLLADSGIPHTWHFANRPSVNPKDEADAYNVQLQNNSITLAEIYAERGMDWEEQLEQRAKETKVLKDKGLIQSNSAPVAPVLPGA
jgi:hypothetical protein